MKIKGLKIPVLVLLVFFGFFLFSSSSNSAKLTTSQQNIARDSKRINSIYVLQKSLELYKNNYSNYPTISLENNYPINGFVSSTMSSWDNFCSELNLADCPIDPINKIADTSNIWGFSAKDIEVISSYSEFTEATSCVKNCVDVGLYIDSEKKHIQERGYTIYIFDSI